MIHCDELGTFKK